MTTIELKQEPELEPETKELQEEVEEKLEKELPTKEEEEKDEPATTEEPKVKIKKTEKTITRKAKQKKENVVEQKTYVMMYGITSGPQKCDICTIATNTFNTDKYKQYFNFHYTNALKPAARKVARQQHIDEMPFFKYKTPEDKEFKFIVGWNSIDWEELMERMK
jgi:outer membrane biosynthesis protein TonB